MTTRIGTHCYRSAQEAKMAYCMSYDFAIAEGRIEVGKPDIKEGESLLVDKKGRYWIERKL